ncbi:ParA family protein [Nocardia sp. XZ_19_231]|uniref:ParA family protein n=1 Tax=Nocardia sp. XZ_19_231 TaxID=2769252 RepID=UPI00188F922C|nr:ParA family protein [Nocardia sp. XZ_19_231]
MTSAVTLEIPKPLVITLGNLKGGATKTTSSFFLACYFAIVHGRRVLVIDADPLSQTGYSWYRRLRDADVEPPFSLVAFPSKQIHQCIDDNSALYDVIIVDAGGESDEIFKAAVRRTQELILMTGTNPSEYNRVPSTFLAASEAAAQVSHEINVRVLLAKVPTQWRTIDGKKVNVSTEHRMARQDLVDAGYELFETFLSDWRWYREAADGKVGKGAENPITDLGEYQAVGDELVARYLTAKVAS